MADKRLPEANTSRSAAADCDVRLHVSYEDAFTNPWLICHQVGAELVESYQPFCFHQGYCNLNEDLWQEVAGGQDRGRESCLYLEQGSFCWVQLGVALHLLIQIKVFNKVPYIIRDMLQDENINFYKRII